jgi:drug/metabolite transporter (DMT)-like permease
MGSLYIVSAILIWSSLGLFLRLLEIPVHEVMFYSALSAAVISGTPVFAQGYRKFLPDIKGTLFLGLVGPLNALNVFTFYYAYRHTSVSNSVFTHYIAPVLVAFMAPFFLKEKLTKNILFAVTVASIGLWVMVGADMGSLLAGIKSMDGNTAGIISGLISGVAYAFLIIAFRINSQKFSSLGQVFILNSVISLILLPFVGGFPVRIIHWLILMGLVHSTIGSYLYLKGLQTVAANRAAVLGYFEPLGAILFAIVLLGEYPSSNSIFGGALILAAGYLTLREK